MGDTRRNVVGQRKRACAASSIAEEGCDVTGPDCNAISADPTALWGAKAGVAASLLVLARVPLPLPLLVLVGAGVGVGLAAAVQHSRPRTLEWLEHAAEGCGRDVAFG